MNCPKCGYLGFEQLDRCRNCGYDFSLSEPADDLELPLRADAPVSEPLREMSLPLFGGPIPDDQPLITKLSPPRTPLAVRRATPEVPRLRTAEPRLQSLDLTDDTVVVRRPEPPAARTSIARSDERVERSARVAPAEQEADAGLGPRLFAVLIDVCILGLVDLMVVYLTMQICGLGLGDLRILPRGPLFAFLLLQNGGYLVAFTVGGQTLGKLAAGIRVVSAEPDAPLDLGRAVVREALWLLLAVPAGLGLLTVLAPDHRGIHDRFAGTRVVRAV